MSTNITTISNITNEVSVKVRNVLGDKLRKIILYGSYAWFVVKCFENCVTSQRKTIEEAYNLHA